MSIILELKTPDWTLRVRANKNQDRLETLKKTLAARELAVPTSKLLLSPALTVWQDEENEFSASPLAEISLSEPVLFENKKYQFTIVFSPEFKSETKPIIKHRLRNIEDAFFYDEDSRNLSGNVEFSNNVGWFRLGFGYRRNGIEHIQYISLEVLPVKMAMEQDLEQIHQTIDSQYPLWRFSFAKQTDQELARKRQEHEHFPLLWLAHFAQLRESLSANAGIILRAPHTRLLATSRRARLHQLRGRLPSKLEERVKEHIDDKEDHHRYLIRSRHLSTDTPENRFIKMALIQCRREIASILDLAKKNQPAPDEGRLSDSFFEELESWKKPLDQLLNQSFFSDIGRYEGMERESLVLHQRAGYAQVYRIWQQLKMYLDLFGNGSSISMKSVADLYQVWCFLKLKEILETFGFSEQNAKINELSNKGLEKEMIRGRKSSFHLFRETDQLTICLTHEPRFTQRENKEEEGRIYSWTTAQEPDIFLEAQFADGTVSRWIFDAKYRINEKSPVDMAPDDAINQMHRYRDAIIHIDKDRLVQETKSRPVLGAFVLYPGWFEEKSGGNPYHNSIEEVGIGAFPLLPGQSNRWLTEFLEKQFGTIAASRPYPVSAADRYLIEDSVRIPVTGTFLGQYRDLTLLANLGHLEERTAEYAEHYRNGTARWYHVPLSTTMKMTISHRIMQETRYCAVAVQVKNAETGLMRKIEFLYEVTDVSVHRRNTLSVVQTGKTSESKEEYWLFELGQAIKIADPLLLQDDTHFNIFHTSGEQIRQGRLFGQLPRYYPELIYNQMK